MTTDSIQELETLEAWKQAKDFAVKVCEEVLPLLPAEEKWTLSQQIRRAVQSVPANIARGSRSETYTHLTIAHELSYFNQRTYVDLRKQVEDLIRIMNGYIAYLKRVKVGANELGASYTIRQDPASYSTDYLEDVESSENQ